MSSPEPTGTRKMSPLFGVSKTRLKGMDDGLTKTLQNAIDRWTAKRIEFIESLPEQTRSELDEIGMLQAPDVELPGAKPRARTAPNGNSHRAAPATAPRGRI